VANVVVTTYAIMCNELARKEGALFQTAWFRVVFDEGELRIAVKLMCLASH